MNKKINQLTLENHKIITSIYKELDNINMTLINIKIATAKLKDRENAGALEVVVDHIKKTIKDLENKTYSIKENNKSIANSNKN